MITSFAPSLLNDIAQRFVESALYASLHYEIPDYAQPTLSELQFGGYVRQAVYWSDVISGIATVTNLLSWIGLEPPVRIAAIGITRTLSGNELLAYGALDPPITSANTSWEVPGGAISIRVV